MKKPSKQVSKFLPKKILENNERVAEVQFICDSCGKLVRTSLVTKNDLNTQNNKKVTCWQCKQAKSTSEKS